MKETNHYMDYPGFLEVIRNMAEPIAGEGGRVSVTHIIKNNGCEYDGLIIKQKDVEISPTIYVNGFYEEYLQGKNIDDIFNCIRDTYEYNKNRIVIDTDSLKSFEGIKDKVVYKLINYNYNRKLLESVPHKKFLDLAMVFYCLIKKSADGNATALIYNTHMDNWNIHIDDLYHAALGNTPKLLKSTIKPMSMLLGREEFDESEEYSVDDMYVLTNSCKLNGAACILYDNVLERFSDRLNRDLYILPSSIHEVILLPKLDIFDKNELINMVREVNIEGVPKDEVLSDNVYEYDRKTGQVVLI